jgi:cytochrome P450
MPDDVHLPDAPLPVFDPFAAGFFDDPYPTYARQREADPVHLSPLGPWILFRHGDASALLRDPSLSVDVRKAVEIDPRSRRRRDEMLDDLFPGRERREDTSILNVDPPDHTRLRRLVSKVFTPRRVEDLRPLVRRLVDERLDAVATDGRMDVIADLAFPLPFAVISEMLGMPEGDRDELRRWSHSVVQLLDITLTPDEVREGVVAAERMRAHVARAIAWKRERPADDLLTALITAEDEGDVLSETELVDQIVLLFIAGHETTVNLIGNGTLALLRHPEQLERWRDDVTLDANAVHELLRFDSPVQFSRRIALHRLEIGGRVIEPGRFVMTCLGSANRDPAVFGPDADVLDLGRPSAPLHLSFGSGTHYCLGSALARLEGAEAIGALIRRFDGLRLATDRPMWNGRLVLRGLDALPVTFSSARSVRSVAAVLS